MISINPDRFRLLKWLEPTCEPDAAALFYPKGERGLSPGWINSQADVQRAVSAYRQGNLADEVFQAINKKGVPYTIRGAQRLGLVPHREGLVAVFCVDLDDHTGDGGNVHLLALIARFVGAEPLVFTSKSGRGLHCFFRLRTPMPVAEFVAWLKGWGFNRSGQPEVFPKTAKQTQMWLPNDPNENGGDTYRGGSFASCLVDRLPSPPSVRLTNSTLDYLRGFVAAGGRNTRLNAAAHELGRKGIPEAEARRLCGEGSRLSGLEADDTAQSEATFESGYQAGRSAAPERTRKSPKFYTLDGIGNGERFVAVYGKRVRYCYELQQWFAWTGKRWTALAEPLVQKWAKRAAKRIRREAEAALDQPGVEDRDKLRTAYQRHARNSAGFRGIQEMLAMAQSEPGIQAPLQRFDRDPDVLNVLNGTLDLRTGELRPHRRRDALTKMLSVRYLPAAVCPTWDRFLDRSMAGDRELIAFIQRAVGYTLTGQVGEQCLFFLYGGGSNGKSVFVQTLLYVLGEYGQKAPAEMLMKQERGSGGASPELLRLRGVRLAVASELEEGRHFGEARVKDLTGADRVVARPLYCNPVEFEPTHKLWIYGNHKPTIKGTDDGIWRRIRLIPFNVKIPPEERDPQLMAKLELEAEGILAWAVRGCLTWRRDGLAVPHAVSAATEEYRRDSDRLQAFIQERCVIYPEAWVAKGDFYLAYEAWSRAGAERPWTKRKVGEALTAHGYQEGRDGSSRYWLGIGLADDGSTNPGGAM